MLVISVFCVVASAVAQCSYRNGDVAARWQVSDDELTVEFVNRNIGNNQWTGISFGESMNDLEVVLVKIEDNIPSLVTGFTSGYGPPILDSTLNVVPSVLSFNSNQLRFRITRPLSLNGERSHSLEECQQWSFIKEGNLEKDGEVGSHTALPTSIEVCPKKCEKNAAHKHFSTASVA